jgi:hypothetical protein
MRPHIQQEHGLVIRGQDRQLAAVGAVGQYVAFGRKQLFAERHVGDTRVMLPPRVLGQCGDPRTVRADGLIADGRAGDPDLLADAGRGHVPEAQPVVPFAAGH